VARLVAAALDGIFTVIRRAPRAALGRHPGHPSTHDEFDVEQLREMSNGL